MRNLLLIGTFGLITWGAVPQVRGQSEEHVAPRHNLSLQVRLAQAQTALKAGNRELANRRFRAVLNADPGNGSAQLGIVSIMVAEAAHSARPNTEIANAAFPVDDPDTKAIRQKLQNIIIPNAEFRQTTLNDAVEFLRQEARRLDTQSPEDERGINIFLKLSASSTPATTDAAIPGLPAGAPPAETASGNTRISLTLTNIPLYNAIDYVAKAANLKTRIEPYGVSILPFAEDCGELRTREFHVAPSFFGPEQRPSVTTSDVIGCSELQGTSSAKGILEACGVTFPPGSYAVFLRQTGKLVVRDTQNNLDLVEALIADAAGSPQPTLTP